MSDTNRPQRIEVLEPSVGEIKAELSHTWSQIEQIMSMMQQLPQTKSADGGQREEKSGGSGRGDANNDSGDAGRVPSEEGVAATRVGASTETAKGGKISSHSSRASDGPRPADDTGREPEVPAGVSLSGKARDSFLADIAAHDGNGILCSGFQRQPRVLPPVLKGEKGKFQKFKHDFLLKANMLDISDHFVGQRARVVLVGDPFRGQCCYGKVFQVRKSEERSRVRRIDQS